MHFKCIVLLLFLFSLWSIETESRKVTQKPTKPAPPPPPKKDKSWVRSKIDSAKSKYEVGKQKIKSKIASFGSKSKNSPIENNQKTTAKQASFNQKTTAKRTNFNQKTTEKLTNWNQKTTKSYGWNSNIQGNGEIPNQLLTTKKPFIDRMKEKAKKSEKYVGKAVGWAKKDLGIGVEGPKKPSKILKFGKKAVEYVFKKKSPKVPVAGYSSGIVNSNGYSQNVGYSEGIHSESYSQNSERSSYLHEKVEYLRNRLELMQQAIQGTWNTSEAGTKYKIFEEKKNWNDAQLHCEELGSNLAYLDSESKNNYAKSLLDSQNITMVWFGLRTEIGTETGIQSQDQFSNFSNLDGCGVVDRNGTWSISSCLIELPYLCQAFRFDVLVEIP